MVLKGIFSTLMPRWFVINTLITALLVTAYSQGLLDQYLGTITHIIPVIITISFYFTILSGFTANSIRKSWLDIENQKLLFQNAVAHNRGDEFRDNLAETLHRQTAIFRMAGPLLGSIGLFGTILGISIGFATLTPDVLADPTTAQTAMISVLTGLATSFHSTMAGISGMVWNMINLHLLRQENSRLYTTITEV